MSNPFSEFCPKCDAHHAAGDCLAWLRKQYHDLRAKLQTAEQQLETLQGSLNEAEFHANNYRRSFEEMKAASIASANRANAAEQQLGQAREEVRRLLAFVEKASRLDTSQTCSPGNEDVVLEAMEILSATPSDGWTDKERLDWLELENFSLERQWNLETKGPGGVRLDVTSSKDHWKEPTIREAIDKAMEEAFDKGKEGV